MPTGPLPFDRKDFLKERKPSSSDTPGVVPVRWRETPITPSSLDNNRGSFSYRCGGAGGTSDFRRPFSGYRIGGWRVTTLEPLQDKFCGNDSKENNHSNGGTTGGHNEKSLGSSIDWKPLKWNRSGSLSSRGSVDMKLDGVAGNFSPLESPSDDGVPSLTPRTPDDDVSSRKKPRLGWGEGLAKYEKKKVGPDDDVADKEGGPANGTVDDASPCSQLDKSPSLTGGSECASPFSFACSSSPGIEEKANAVDNDICNPSCHISPTHTEGSPFNLDNPELTEAANMSSLLTELVQSDDTSTQASGVLKSTAMDKLQVWKADISRTLEITESEIDSLENELKSLVSSSLPPTEECIESGNSSGDMSIEKADGSEEEHTGVEDLDRESPGTATSQFVEPSTSSDNTTPSDDDVSNGSCSTVTVAGNVHYNREDYDPLFASNKADANEASDACSNLIPNIQWCENVPRFTNDSLVKENFYTRKRFLKFKERVITLKFRAFQYLWKEDLRLLSVRKSGAKSHKKSESSSRMIGFTDHQKHPASIRSTGNGNLSLAPTTEIIEYVNKLLSDSQMKIYNNNTLKMPSMILDKNERVNSRFISYNGLVENPCEVEIERSRANIWTSEEKEMFLEKFSLFGKDFRKIASFLHHKTVADCVEFYYKNHKSERFQKTKKHPGGSNPSNMYLLTSGKRWTRDTNATASANVEETAAADVLAGICGSISSEAMSSCITSFVDSKRQLSTPDRVLQYDVDEETCSDESESCEGETINPSTCDWTDEEKSSFLQAVKLYGGNKDFEMISRYVKTRSGDECKVFYSKARKCLGLDSIHVEQPIQAGPNHGSDHDHDHDDACMVDSGVSVISCDKSSSSEDPHSKQEVVESDQVNEGKHKPEVGLVEVEVEFEERGLNGNLMDLNSAVELPCFEGQSDGFPAFTQDGDISSRLSFRKSGGSQRSSSKDGYHLHLPKHSLMDCVESSQILRGFPVTVGSTLAYNEKQKTQNLSLRMCTTNAESSEVGKPRDIKLFGQILTNSSSQQHQTKPNGRTSFSLKFDNHIHSVDESNNNNNNGFENVPLRKSYGFWDGNRIQTGFPSLPASSILLAKYPAAFAKFEQQQGSNNRYSMHQPFTVDKLLSEMPTRNRSSENLSSLQCNGVSDPVTAIRMHYAKTEHYNNGGNGDIGSR